MHHLYYLLPVRVLRLHFGTVILQGPPDLTAKITSGMPDFDHLTTTMEGKARQYAEANEKAISFITMRAEKKIDCDFTWYAYVYTQSDNYVVNRE